MSTPNLHQSKYGRSTGMVVTGALLLVVSAGASAMGSQEALRAATSIYGSSSAGSGFFIVGALAGFVGLIVLVMGLSQMTTNIDLTAQYVAELMRRDLEREAAELELAADGERSGRRAVSSAGRGDEPATVTGETRRTRRATTE